MEQRETDSEYLDTECILPHIIPDFEDSKPIDGKVSKIRPKQSSENIDTSVEIKEKMGELFMGRSIDDEEKVETIFPTGLILIHDQPTVILTGSDNPTQAHGFSYTSLYHVKKETPSFFQLSGRNSSTIPTNHSQTQFVPQAIRPTLHGSTRNLTPPDPLEITLVAATPKERKRRQCLERVKRFRERKRKSETPEERERKRRQTKKRVKRSGGSKRRTQNETPEERTARLATLAECRKKRLAKETPEQRSARIAADAVRRRKHLANETPEQRKLRIAAIAERQKKRFASETLEQKTCEECGKSLSNSAALQRHLKTHTGQKSYNCGLVSESILPDIEPCVDQNDEIHPKTLPGRNNVEKMGTMAEIKEEWDVEVPEVFMGTLIDEENDETIFPAVLVEKTPETDVNVAIPSEEKSYECTLCSSRFSTMLELSNHGAKKHFLCTLCGLKFCTSVQRNDHVLGDHEHNLCSHTAEKHCKVALCHMNISIPTHQHRIEVRKKKLSSPTEETNFESSRASTSSNPPISGGITLRSQKHSCPETRSARTSTGLNPKTPKEITRRGETTTLSLEFVVPVTETPEERKRRRNLERTRRFRERKRQNESLEERELRQSKERLQQSLGSTRRKLSETPEERGTRLATLAERKRQRLANETPEQRNTRLATMAGRQRNYLALETPEQRMARLAANAERKRMIKAKVTHEDVNVIYS